MIWLNCRLFYPALLHFILHIIHGISSAQHLQTLEYIIFLSFTHWFRYLLSTVMTFVAQVRICVFRPSPFPSVVYSVLMKLHEKLFLFCRKTILFLDLGVTTWRRLSWNLRYRAIKSAVSESPNRKRVPMSLVHFSLRFTNFDISPHTSPQRTLKASRQKP